MKTQAATVAIIDLSVPPVLAVTSLIYWAKRKGPAVCRASLDRVLNGSLIAAVAYA